MSGRVNRSFWGWVSGHGPGSLVEINRRLTAEGYVWILENVLYPEVTQRYPNQVVNVIEDNSSIHTARICQEWWTRHPMLRRLNHPAKSPDLNYIENVWSRMVRRWVPTHGMNVDGLRDRVVNSWINLREGDNWMRYFENLANSMPRRLQMVIDAQGAPINY